MTPVGFRFHPSAEEIIDHYLAHKLEGRDYLVDDHIGEIDHLYQRDPWDLPDYAIIQSDDRVWYFFCRLDFKHASGKRINRKTKNGNWKLTGKVRDITRRGTNEVIGTKRNVVFQQKCPASGKLVGTDWVIHEFQSRTSPPNERALVLCKLKDRGNKSAADLPNDEGEASRFMGPDFDNNAAETHNREVDASWLVSLINSDEDDINLSLPLQSQIHVQNSLLGEEDLTDFADSFLVIPDEYGSENAAFSHPSSYILQSPSHAYEEPANLYGGHGDLKIARQLQMAHGDDILLMGASSMGSTTATRHEHIESMPSDGEVIPKTHHPLPPLIMAETRQHRPPAIMPKTRLPPAPVMAPKLVEHEKVSHKDIRFQGMIARSFIPQAEVVTMESSGIAESDRKRVPVTNPKPRSNDMGRKGRFIHHETTISSHRSCPPLVYLLKAVLGVVLFLFMLREALIVH